MFLPLDTVFELTWLFIIFIKLDKLIFSEDADYPA